MHWAPCTWCLLRPSFYEQQFLLAFAPRYDLPNRLGEKGHEWVEEDEDSAQEGVEE
ncbi:MAG: hypothetical protein U1A28_02945 [Patescibacteria group bacterium]|nr:hypothetical protein [Patescibacteria group bacterium]